MLLQPTIQFTISILNMTPCKLSKRKREDNDVDHEDLPPPKRLRMSVHICLEMPTASLDVQPIRSSKIFSPWESTTQMDMPIVPYSPKPVYESLTIAPYSPTPIHKLFPIVPTSFSKSLPIVPYSPKPTTKSLSTVPYTPTPIRNLFPVVPYSPTPISSILPNVPYSPTYIGKALPIVPYSPKPIGESLPFVPYYPTPALAKILITEPIHQ